MGTDCCRSNAVGFRICGCVVSSVNEQPNEMARIPEHRRPDGRVFWSEVQPIRMPPFGKVMNRVGVIFDGDDPVVAGEDRKDVAAA